MANFQSVMSAIGSGLKKFLGFQPLITLAAAIIPGGGVLTSIMSIVNATERLFTNAGISAGNGLQKLQAALPDVMEIVKQSELVAGSEIVDTAQFQSGCQAIISGVVQIQNSLKFNQKADTAAANAAHPQITKSQVQSVIGAAGAGSAGLSVVEPAHADTVASSATAGGDANPAATPNPFAK